MEFYMESINGIVEGIIFHNEKNGYSVVSFDVSGNMVTGVGYFDEINEGEFLKLTGYWEEHLSYGEQFHIDHYAIDLPTSKDGLIRYLSSGLLPGIGEKTAIEIVNKFGDKTLDVFDHQPERLLEIKGIGKKTFSKMMEEYQEQRGLRDIVIKIQEYGISSNYALKLYKAYHEETINVLLTNPYQMINDIRGIGFNVADKIASQLGVEHSDQQRLLFGIKFTLQNCYKQGNTYLLEKELIVLSARLLGVHLEDVEDLLQELVFSGDISMEIMDEQRAYYPKNLLIAEDTAALNIARLVQAEVSASLETETMDKMIDNFESSHHIALDSIQHQAIITAITNSIVILTGGPGTGKTTIINAIVTCFHELKLSVVLAAPTGRAAKRMTETTGESAQTIHRLLEYAPGMEDELANFGKDAENPIDADAIIIDESSMIDTLLMAALMDAIQPGTRLILTGDADQLPSVGPGMILLDLIKTDLIPVVCLEKIYRQSKDSMISLNAHAINQGIMPTINNQSDFIFIQKSEQEVILETIIDLVMHRIPEKKGFNAFEEIQVISPVKKGPLGTIALNKALQQALNPADKNKTEKTFGTITFREGDKVMQIKNNYQIEWEEHYSFEVGQGLYNGDIGIISSINLSKKQMEIYFDDHKKVLYSFDHLEELTHAYAMTVHKSQGSEFPVVIMPMISGSPIFLNRKLLYTAVTRAKRLLMLIGGRKYFYQMVNSTATNERRTGLTARVIDYYHMKI